MPNPPRLIFEPGTKFNKLTVIERADDIIVGKDKQHRTAYKCRCDCGNEVVVEAAKLKNGQTKSCGCLHPGGQKGLKSLVGKQYGKLTVIERGPDKIDPSGRHRTRWWCRCSCENQTMVLVEADCLVGGYTRTCGCSRAEQGLKSGSQIAMNFGTILSSATPKRDDRSLSVLRTTIWSRSTAGWRAVAIF